MDSYDFSDRDHAGAANLRYVPLVAALSCAWFVAAAVLYPVFAVFGDLREAARGRR